MKRLTATAGTKSKLAKPVQELIKTIFDVESMKKAMVEFEVRLLDLFGQHTWLWREKPHQTDLVCYSLHHITSSENVGSFCGEVIFII